MHLPWQHRAPGDGPAIPTSVTRAEAAVLARLAPGKTILEIGSAYGYSACVMALAGAESVLAVDPHTWIRGSHHAMLENLAAYRVADRVEVIPELSFQALPWLEREGARFGMAFIDGDHSAHAVRHDVNMALALLEPGGILAVHDTTEDCCCPGVAAALAGFTGLGTPELTDTLAVYRTGTPQ